jgi:hypothetical protein
MRQKIWLGMVRAAALFVFVLVAPGYLVATAATRSRAH